MKPARIFHRVSTAAAQSGMSTALRLFGLLDILSICLRRPLCARPVSIPACAASPRNPMKYPDYLILSQTGRYKIIFPGFPDNDDGLLCHTCQTRPGFQKKSYRRVDKSTGLRSDQSIVLSGFTTAKRYPVPLRKIAYHAADIDKRFIFLTNNFDLPAITIAQLYKSRWQVELFFKWIKQYRRIFDIRLCPSAPPACRQTGAPRASARTDNYSAFP